MATDLVSSTEESLLIVETELDADTIISVEEDVLIVESEGTTEIIEIATPGPQGPAGDTNSSYVTASALSGHQVIALDSSGLAVYASCDDISYALRVVGISESAATLGNPIITQFSGVMTYNGWAWTPGQLIYLGLNGAIVSTIPITATFILVLGKALSSTKILIGIQQPITI